MSVWEVTVVIEIPVEPHDTVPAFTGDAEIDYAQRAVAARLRPALEALRASIPESHWMIRVQPNGALARRCVA